MNEQPGSKFIQEDIDLLKSLNESPVVESNIYFTAKHSGYMRSLDHGVLQHLENAYKRTINPAFVLCFHCSNEIMSMVTDLYEALEKDQAVFGATAAPDVDLDIDQPDTEIPGNLLHKLTATDIDGMGADTPFGEGDLITYLAGTDWKDMINDWRTDKGNATDTTSTSANEGDIPPVTLGDDTDGNPIIETISVETEPPAADIKAKKTRTKKNA